MPNALKNLLLVLVTVVLCTAAAEGMVRWLEAGGTSPALKHLDAIKLASGVDRAWFGEDPPALPNRHPVTDEARELVKRVEASGVTEGTRRADMFKAWNSVYVGDPCTHPYLKNAPGVLHVYDPPDGSPRPSYRFLPDTTTPIGLVTNQYGFRGPPVPQARQPRTIRIAFVGASTTVSSHNFPYSYPEHVGFWLDKWARARKLDVRFEILNAGREGINSADIAAIVRNEVAPLAPDLVVYYEGANQFNLRTVVPEVPNRPSDAPMLAQVDQGPVAATLENLGYTFALARRLKSLLYPPKTEGTSADGREWPKPDYAVRWPEGLDEGNPQIDRQDLPVNLVDILRDLDSIRATLAPTGGEFALASFKWLVADGLVLDPVRHRLILEYLNIGYAPFRYRDLERLAVFQNRVLRTYAASRGIDFMDVAGAMPSDPDLFVDGIHNTPEGIRLRAWIVLQLLVPIVDRHLSDGSWPRKAFPQTPAAAPYKPRRIEFDCRKKG